MGTGAADFVFRGEVETTPVIGCLVTCGLDDELKGLDAAKDSAAWLDGRGVALRGCAGPAAARDRRLVGFLQLTRRQPL
jgi:hypothetical protein